MRDRRRIARDDVLVGRRAERAALDGGRAAPRLLYLHGPAGVGKTALVHAWIAKARARRLPVAYLDARRCVPSPRSLLQALSTALGIPARASPLRRLRAIRRRHLIVIDTYEAVAPLDDWVREVIVPELTDRTTLVLAGRQPPSAAWRTLGAAQSDVRFLPLRNLEARDSRALLRARGVPAAQHAAILEFTHGHPLALSLVAELCTQRPLAAFEPDAAPDVVRTLLQQFLHETPDPRQRAALEACAIPRTMTESLLAHMLEVPEEEAHGAFEWLARRSFVESGPDGIFPHDTVREVLERELRWRNRERHSALVARAYDYYRQRLGRAMPCETARDWAYLTIVHHPTPRVCMGSINLFLDNAASADLPQLLAMVQSYEGEAAARIAAYWFRRQLRNVQVVRMAAGELAGFVMALTLGESTPRADLEADPGAAAICRYLQQHGSLRANQQATVYRFWMARDSYQGMGPVEMLIFMGSVMRVLSQPRQVMGFWVTLDPARFEPIAQYTLASRISEADFQIGERRYTVFARDWRGPQPPGYLQRFLRQAQLMQGEASADAPPTVALSVESFTQAVQRALRDLHRPLSLRSNPLLHSRLIASRVGAQATLEERIVALQKAVREAAEAVREAPRAEKLFRALEATYLVEAPAQEAVAERLGLPFSTYRYHLTRAVSRVIERLWEAEIGGE